MPKRPVGVVVVAVVLGLFSALLLLLAAGSVMMAVMFPHMQQTATQPAVPDFLRAMMVILGLVYAAVAGWAITTITGLMRLKNWARLSALVMGGLLAFFGLCSLPILLVMPRLMAASPSGATLPASALEGAVVFMGMIYGGMLAVGVWWLVYFNLRSVKTYFLPGYAQGNWGQNAMYPDTGQNPYLPSRAAQAESLATPGGLAVGTMGQLAAAPLAPGQYPAAAPVAGQGHAPAAILVVGCIFLLGCLCCAGMALVPLPAFVLGVMFTGAGVPILYGCLSVLSGYIGLGLMKLWEGARRATYFFLGFGMVNLVLMVMPWYRTQFLAYQGVVNARVGLPATATAMQQEMYHGPFLPMLVIMSLVMYGIVFWILHRYRESFRKTAVEPG